MRLFGLLVVMAMTMTTTMGCAELNTKNDPRADVPRNQDGTEEWNLRSAPSAADVGIAPGEVDVSYSSIDDPRTVILRLPDGIDWQVDDVTLVTFDAFPAGPFTQPDNEAPDPTGMDLRRIPTDLETAHRHLVDDLAVFGLPPDLANAWRREVEERPTSGAEAGLRIRSGTSVEVGHLTVGLAARFSPVDEKAILAYRISWGDARR